MKARIDSQGHQPDGIAGVFDRAADTYDAVGVEWFGPIAQRLIRELNPAFGERALDLGCGRGAALIPLASAVGPTGHVLGLDLAPRMVAAAKTQTHDLPHVEVRVGDASAPALPRSSYDIIASSLVLFFLPDPSAALTAWADLLVTGGRLGVATLGPQDTRGKALDALFEPYLPPAMLGARTSGQRGPFASDKGVEALLTQAGLLDVRTVRQELPTIFTSPEQWHTWSWSHGQRARWEAVPPHRHEHLRRQAFTKLKSFRDANGQISLPQQIRYTLARRN